MTFLPVRVLNSLAIPLNKENTLGCNPGIRLAFPSGPITMPCRDLSPGCNPPGATLSLVASAGAAVGTGTGGLPGVSLTGASPSWLGVSILLAGRFKLGGVTAVGVGLIVDGTLEADGVFISVFIDRRFIELR